MTEDVLTAGRNAWARLRGRREFEDWLAVGRALVVGRTETLKKAGTNRPVGTRYNRLMGDWLTANGFAEVSAQERYRILLILENLPAVETWRASISDEKRRRFNHPNAVWQAWTAATKLRNEVTSPAETPRNHPSRRATQELIRETWMAMRRSGSSDLIILASIAVDCVLDYQERALAA